MTLPTGEASASDEEARLLGHIAVTRTLMAAGLGVDARVAQAMAAAHALTWTTEGGGHHHTTPLVLAAALWLVALDPLAGDDRPLPIDWSPQLLRARLVGRGLPAVLALRRARGARSTGRRASRASPRAIRAAPAGRSPSRCCASAADSRAAIALPMLASGAEAAADAAPDPRRREPRTRPHRRARARAPARGGGGRTGRRSPRTRGVARSRRRVSAPLAARSGALSPLAGAGGVCFPSACAGGVGGYSLWRTRSGVMRMRARLPASIISRKASPGWGRPSSPPLPCVCVRCAR